MNVIGHKAEGHHAYSGVRHLLADKAQIHPIVGGAKKDPLMIRPALGHMVGQSGFRRIVHFSVFNREVGS